MSQAGSPTSATPSEFATSEMPVTDAEEVQAPAAAAFPPYPPYAVEPAPPSVADTIMAGRDIRRQHKSIPRKSMRPVPKPARPRGPKATDVKMSKRALTAHARCLRRHGAILTDRLERISKPRRRDIIYLWRDNAHRLPPETIGRLRSMLDADEPFKPDQAYEYFINLKKSKKKNVAMRVNQIKRDVAAICGDKRFVWARNATVAFARGIQQRLSRPGRYALADGMLRLSNIILDEICGHMHMKTPSRRCTHPKAKFMMEMADKVAIWIDEILSESDDRMLMMDFDEDEEVEQSNIDELRPESEPEPEVEPDNLTTSASNPATAGDTPTITPGDTPAATATGSQEPTPAATPSQTPRTSKTNLQQQYPTAAADDKYHSRALIFLSTDILRVDEAGGDAGFADDFLNMMADGGLLRGAQPAHLRFTGEMLEAFTILTDSMYKKGDALLISHGKFNETYSDAADELKRAPSFEVTDYNITLANQINSDLSDTVKSNTPDNIRPHMKEMVEICSNYLAQYAEYNKDKGPAFKHLVKMMHGKPNEMLYQKDKARRTYGTAATELEESKGLESNHDDPNLSQEIHSKLSKLVEGATPGDVKPNDMKETLDTCSKYISQAAVDENERGPAFDILIHELEYAGGEPFTPDIPCLGTNYAAAYTLKSAPGFSSVSPDPSTVPMFVALLHKVVDTATPKALKKEMSEVIQRCANYLSAFARDRDKVIGLLLKMMKANPNKEFAKRNNYTMTYGIGASEIETAPALTPFLPIKDIADEGREKLTKDMAKNTPTGLEVAMKTAIDDASKHLSQATAVHSGFGGDRYPLNLLAAVKKSLGNRPLFKYKVYGQTYSDAGDVLRYAGPLESDPRAEDLKHQIHSEMKRGVPTKLAPTITEDLQVAMDDAAKHLAKVGMEKGDALEHLVNLMKDKGEVPLGQLQGYQQTYSDGARRVEDAPSLYNDKVDKGAYEGVKGKLTDLVQTPPLEHEKNMPGIIDETSKFLASPFPETEADKRHVLADLMGRKGSAILGQDGPYKMTYAEGGVELMKAPVGVTTAYDEAKKKGIHEQVTGVIPEKKLQNLLKDPTDEGSAYLTDVINGRGEAMKVIHQDMKKERSKEFISVGSFEKTHGEAADMITSAKHFADPHHPAPVILDQVSDRVDALPKRTNDTLAKEHMHDASDITSRYIAGVATEECGLDPKALAELDSSGQPMSEAARKQAEEARRRREEDERRNLSPEEQRRRREEDERRRVEEERRKNLSPEEQRRLREEDERKRVEEERRRNLSPEEQRRLREEDERRRLEEERRRNLSPEEQRRLREEDERRRQEEEERWRRGEGRGRLRGSDGRLLTEEESRRLEEERRRAGGRGGAYGAEFDPEHEAALTILHKQLRARGGEILYKQPHTELTHAQASDWIAMKPPMKVDKTVKESGDTARLHKKFERKLGALVSKVTPNEMYDAMQDVIVESARILSEYFVSRNYKALVREALVSEMQRRGNEILVEVDGAAETFFFAAQRLKKVKSLDVKEPCNQVAYYLTKKLEEAIRCRSMARKLTATMKDHIKDAADYLSENVTKPDERIEAYVSLLGEMEVAGDALLIEGDIPKSNKDAAAYLRQLTSYDDQIRRPNSSLQSSTESKLKSLMANVTPTGYTKSTLHGVIADSTRLLVSYIMLQGEKTEALKILIEQMERAGSNVLLRHGAIRKTYAEGASILHGKNTDQLAVTSADPVVVRKIEIKLNNLMQRCTPDKYQPVMDDVIEDATMYLAVHLLQPQVIQVCKCMKNVFVQCELWCDEILRHVARPCCTCSRHVSAQALEDLAPVQRLRLSPGTSHLFAPGVEISLTHCPSKQLRKNSERSTPCPASKPTSGCLQGPTTSYLMYSTLYGQKFGYGMTSPSDLLRPTPPEKFTDNQSPISLSKTPTFDGTPARSLISDLYSDSVQISPEQQSLVKQTEKKESSGNTSPVYYTPPTSSTSGTSRDANLYATLYWQKPPLHKVQPSPIERSSRGLSITRNRSPYNTSTPIVTTDQMSDWHAMMVSLMWNVQAWRDWIQENIDRALKYQLDPAVTSPEEAEESWSTFQRRVATEALQWRQYNNFSRLLTLRLSLRYRDKQIVSPTRATVKTESYAQCQREMLEIIEMFNRWTRWLTVVVKETDALQQVAGSSTPIHELRWNHFKKKVEEYAEDWTKYNTHLKICWEHRYRSIIADWLPAWTQTGPVWVVSACGAVPSGAVAGGVFDGEVVWVARTTHRCNVMPAALHPSKHCCLVYADGAVYRYTKYQVMCNADVTWVAWRAGTLGARAVRVAGGVYAGRVQYRGSHLLGAVHAPSYRCHVVIFGRPFAFNCYELLVLAE